MLTVATHPLLAVYAFTTQLPERLGALPTPDWLRAALAVDHEHAPLRSSDAVRAAVRDLLRVGGYKPTGRGKPASEYVLNAVAAGTLGGINAAVDACNVASLHSGLPVSVIDLDRARGPLRIELAEPGARYVFNRAGQEIDVGGLWCLFDAEGPCANPVKDAQRTKTDEGTTRTLSVVWGTTALEGRSEATGRYYRALLERLGARTELAATS